MSVSLSSTSGASSALSSSGGTSSSDLAALQRKLRELTDALKRVPTEDGDTKAKQQKAKLLQTQIQMVQHQIEALMRQKQQEQLDRQREKQQASELEALRQGRKPATPGLGGSVDTYA
ncbi:MAG: FlxA-like family protein [Acidovorax sp.]|nr:FlxA-like family protein [Acidovorax sp.]